MPDVFFNVTYNIIMYDVFFKLLWVQLFNNGEETLTKIVLGETCHTL